MWKVLVAFFIRVMQFLLVGRAVLVWPWPLPGDVQPYICFWTKWQNQVFFRKILQFAGSFSGFLWEEELSLIGNLNLKVSLKNIQVLFTLKQYYSQKILKGNMYLSLLFIFHSFQIFRSTPVIFINVLWPSLVLLCWKLNIYESTSLNQGLELLNDMYMHTLLASRKIFLHLFMSLSLPVQKMMPRCVSHRSTTHWDFPCSQPPYREHFCFHLLL